MLDVMLQEIYLIISKYEKRNQKRKRYNIFKVLEMTDREVMMCRVLTDFLNPEGTHGKGTKYLKMFLHDVLKRDDYDEICADAHVYKEYLITEERRIDIVIETTDVFIPIEVKIHAGDQKAQCYDYYMYAKRKDNKPKVIYLTKTGTMPSDESLSAKGKTLEDNRVPEDGIQCISFVDDIRCFMQKIVDSEQDAVIKEIADQYLDAINSFIMFADEELKMEVVEQLCKNEQNFRSMLMIEQVTNCAKTKLLYNVMEDIENMMVSVVKQYGMKRENDIAWYDYKIDTSERFYDQKGSTYPGINYVFSDIKLPHGVQLWFRIEIDYNLYAGLCLFDTENNDEFDLGMQSDNRTQEVLAALGEQIGFDKNNLFGWWIKWWYLPSAKDNERLVDKTVPNFKEMNEAVISLVDNENRVQFARKCVAVINEELKKILKR